jgi:hypothetical protein
VYCCCCNISNPSPLNVENVPTPQNPAIKKKPAVSHVKGLILDSYQKSKDNTPNALADRGGIRDSIQFNCANSLRCQNETYFLIHLPKTQKMMPWTSELKFFSIADIIINMMESKRAIPRISINKFNVPIFCDTTHNKKIKSLTSTSVPVACMCHTCIYQRWIWFLSA